MASSSFSADIFYKHNPEGAWTVTGSNDDSLLDFSAVCYFTAMHMKLSLPAMKDVPIGIVQGSKGGTTIESWMNAPALVAAGLPAANATCGFTGGCAARAYFGNLYRFIVPMAPLTFKLLAWYQGEANEPCNAVNGPFTTLGYYAKLLPAFLTAWRTLFRSPLSDYIVTLASVGATQETSADRDNVTSLVSLREAQLTPFKTSTKRTSSILSTRATTENPSTPPPPLPPFFPPRRAPPAQQDGVWSSHRLGVW